MNQETQKATVFKIPAVHQLPLIGQSLRSLCCVSCNISALLNKIDFSHSVHLPSVICNMMWVPLSNSSTEKLNLLVKSA
jgi:hypothetical protein